MMTYDQVSTPVGRCTVAMEKGRLSRVTFNGTRGLSGSRGRMPEVRKRLKAWFAGRSPRVAMDLSGATPFERRVYGVVRRIPRGRTLTYGEVARKTGRPGAARAVGRAMGRNPICLFVP